MGSDGCTLGLGRGWGGSHDAILGRFVFFVDPTVDHSLNQPAKFCGHGRSLEDLRLSLLCHGWRFSIWRRRFRVLVAPALGARLWFSGWHETVVAAEMHSLAAQICPPCTFLAVEEGQNLSLFGDGNEVFVKRKPWHSCLERRKC